MRRSRVSRALLLGVAFLALEGHVTIAPGDVVPGASTRFTVRVPTERPEPTVKLRLEFPEGLGAPRFLAKPGWTYELEKDAAGKVTAVTWSGGRIGADEFDEFVFTARAPEAAGTLFFKAYQTYASGEVVGWVNTEGEEGPAPRVVVQEGTTAPSAAQDAAQAPATETPQSGAAGWMGGVALALSALALALAVRRRA